MTTDQLVLCLAAAAVAFGIALAALLHRRLG